MKRSNKLLEYSTADFDRLQAVLRVKKLWDVVPVSEYIEAKEEVSKAVQPQFDLMFQKVEMELGRLERREKSLKSKAELQEGRRREFAQMHAARLEKTSEAESSQPAKPEMLARLDQLERDVSRLQSSIRLLNLKKQAFGGR